MPLVDPVTMSSTVTKASKAQSVSGKPNEQTHSHPVYLNSTAASKAARHVLPAVLGSLFLASFSRLVADPVSVMWTSLPVVVTLQLLYAFFCLPVAGSGSARSRKPKPGEKKKGGDSGGPNFVIVRLTYYLSIYVAAVVHLLIADALLFFFPPGLTPLPPAVPEYDARPPPGHDPLRRPLAHPFVAHILLRRPPVYPHLLPAGVRARSRAKLLGSCGRLQGSFRRDIRRSVGWSARCLARCRAHPLGLGQGVAEVARDNSDRHIRRLRAWSGAGRLFALWEAVLSTILDNIAQRALHPLTTRA